MKFIRAGIGDNIDKAAQRAARFCFVSSRFDLNLLNEIVGQTHPTRAYERIRHFDTVDEVLVLKPRRASDVHLISVVACVRLWDQRYHTLVVSVHRKVLEICWTKVGTICSAAGFKARTSAGDHDLRHVKSPLLEQDLAKTGGLSQLNEHNIKDDRLVRGVTYSYGNSSRWESNYVEVADIVTHAPTSTLNVRTRDDDVCTKDGLSQ